MLWDQMITFLKSFFVYEGVGWDLMLITIALAIAFGAVWLCAHWIPLMKKPQLWGVMVSSAILTLLAVTFIQIPLQHYAGTALNKLWDSSTLANWLLLAGIPSVLISGLVQEGAKMVPMVVWWWRSGKTITPKLGLAIGAAAGAGFGIFEAIWAIGNTYAAGWTTQYISQYGFLGISPFWERFFAIGFHIAVSALVGYGLAKGKGWQFYLIAAGLHALLNYGVVVYQYFAFIRNSNIITPTRLEIYIAVLAVIIAAVVMMLRWRKSREETPGGPAAPPMEPIEPVKTAETGV